MNFEFRSTIQNPHFKDDSKIYEEKEQNKCFKNSFKVV